MLVFQTSPSDQGHAAADVHLPPAQLGDVAHQDEVLADGEVRHHVELDDVAGGRSVVADELGGSSVDVPADVAAILGIDLDDGLPILPPRG